MKNRITAVAAAVLSFAAANAMAAPGDVIGGGNIEFKGKVNSDTCYVQSSAGGSKTILVEMGDVNTTDLANSTLATPAIPQSGDFGAATFEITCSAETGVKMSFAANPSNLETGNKVLKINDGIGGEGLAGGLGIAVYPNRNSTDAFDLTNGVLFEQNLTAGQKVRAQFAAAYVKTTGAIKAGTANATLPFVIVTP
ncbi:fimbrial protein [Pseudomonas sp. SBT1-2]|uniref:fimbrial protein n=1 Tax=Pseudomonas sp. SBT1-2 TaxID=3027852 RepID=UPI002362F071|nr:fimbrial protein [Pseudomonas sp. SBT1-2]